MTSVPASRSHWFVPLVRQARLLRTRLTHPQSTLSVGEDFIISPGAVIARGTRLRAGDRVSIGPRLTLGAHLVVGDDVMISGNVGLIGDDHPFDDSDASITALPARPLATVTIEGDSLIGFGAILVGPLTVGRGAIVGAGALVTSDVAPDTVVVGVPARVVRHRRRP